MATLHKVVCGVHVCVIIMSINMCCYFLTSSCRSHTYATSKVAVTDPQAIQELLSALKGTFVYRYAEDFCRVSSSIIAFTSNNRNM